MASLFSFPSAEENFINPYPLFFLMSSLKSAGVRFGPGSFALRFEKILPGNRDSVIIGAPPFFK
jgi:hypothetical protein